MFKTQTTNKQKKNAAQNQTRNYPEKGAKNLQKLSLKKIFLSNMGELKKKFAQTNTLNNIM